MRGVGATEGACQGRLTEGLEYGVYSAGSHSNFLNFSIKSRSNSGACRLGRYSHALTFFDHVPLLNVRSNFGSFEQPHNWLVSEI